DDCRLWQHARPPVTVCVWQRRRWRDGVESSQRDCVLLHCIRGIPGADHPCFREDQV
ncbi:hypothetical protein H4R20_005694, partial [Coemansia guatemalensis]